MDTKGHLLLELMGNNCTHCIVVGGIQILEDNIWIVMNSNFKIQIGFTVTVGILFWDLYKLTSMPQIPTVSGIPGSLCFAFSSTVHYHFKTMSLYTTWSPLHDFKILLDQLNLAAVLNSGPKIHFSINW